jgi:hypothetical protein
MLHSVQHSLLFFVTKTGEGNVKHCFAGGAECSRCCDIVC